MSAHTPRKVWLIAGKPKNGKTTAAQLLSHYTGAPWGDCSTVIYEALAKEEGVTVDALRAWDKNTLRPKLIAKGDELCLANPCFLSQYLLDQGMSIISGVRKPPEITFLRANNPDIEFCLVWVEALPPDAAKVANTIEPGISGEMYVTPEVKDNTDMAVRAMANEIVYNMDMDHLNCSVKYLAIKHLHYASHPQHPAPAHS